MFAQVVLNGGFSQTFLNYVGTVLHNVRITEGAQAEKNAQFIQVSFNMPERYSAAGSDGQVSSHVILCNKTSCGPRPCFDDDDDDVVRCFIEA